MAASTFQILILLFLLSCLYFRLLLLFLDLISFQPDFSKIGETLVFRCP